LNRTDVEKFDLILAMDQHNLDAIVRLPNTAAHKKKIKLMREFDPLGLGDVPDPYSGGEKDFKEVFEILERSMEGLISSLLKFAPSA
jgi:protein-tyrosine phosphatase